MARRASLGWPITLGVTMIVLIVAILAGWVLLVAVEQESGWWWAIFAVGAVFLGLVLVGVVLYLLISIKEIRLNERQSNFIDAVTHELKSPIASLKLYLQTLSRRNVTEQQQADFYRFMLDDLERLDTLINHVLEAARADQPPTDDEMEEVELASLLQNVARLACQHYRIPEETVQVDAAPAVVRARAIDVEMIFRNLVDNAIKYAGDDPHINIESRTNNGTVITRVIDNGPGIPINQRRRIFRRFVRLGSELERSRSGTGLGLFIVRNLVRRMRGRVNVRGRGAERGAVFEVELPLYEGWKRDAVQAPGDGAQPVA